MKEEPQWQILTFYISLQGRGVGTIQRVCEGSVSLLAGLQRGAVIFASRRAAIKMYGCKWLYMGMYGLNVRATVTSCPWAAHVKTVKEGILGLDPNFQNLIYLLPGLWLAQLKNGQTFPFLSFFPHIHQVLVLIFQVSINYRPWFFIGRALEAVVQQPQNGSSPSIPSCLPFNTSRLD